MTTIDNKKGSREELQMLTFALDNVSYGVNVHQVREVKNFEGVTPITIRTTVREGCNKPAGRSDSSD